MASDWLGVGWEVVASDISRETCLRQVLFPRQAVTARPPCSSCPTASMIPADRRIRLDDPERAALACGVRKQSPSRERS